MRLRLIIYLTLVICLASLPVMAEWKYSKYSGDVENDLCNAILKRLNNYKWKNIDERYRCSWNVVASYPDFKEPPWQDLDPKKYENLIFKLMKYRDCGIGGYFGKKPCQIISPDEYYHKEVQRFIAEGGKLQLWRTCLLKEFADGTVPLCPQTVIQLRWKRDRDAERIKCPGKPNVDWWRGGLYIVTDDLSELYQANNSLLHLLNSQAMFLMNNEIYIVSSGSDVAISIMPAGGCSLTFKEPKRRKM